MAAGLSRFIGGDRVGEFGILFVSLLAMMVVPDLLPDSGGFSWPVPLFFTIVMLSALSTVVGSRKNFLVAATVLILGLVPQWVGALGFGNVHMFGRILIAVFLLYVCVLTLRMVLTAGSVTLEVILAALCVYLLLGLVWAIGFHLVEYFDPGSFSIPEEMLEGAVSRQRAIASALSYFSYVTITTLGYGDVTPVAPLARSLATVEGIIGQIYLVTLIARLVSMETVQMEEGQPQETVE
ncbi:MAG: potassium channel family protein [Gemmatimonadota bacterium]